MQSSEVPLDRSGDADSIQVLFVQGFTRSGTTLLDRLLGELPGFFSAGELRLLWERGVLKDQLCGCGAAFSRCEFWHEVMQTAFGRRERVEAQRIIELGAVARGNTYVPWLRGEKQIRDQSQREYLATLGPLYAAVVKVSGGRIIVDSSKDRPYAALLGNIAGVDLRVVRVVRDSRAVAFSWERKKPLPEARGAHEYMPRRNAVRTALEWSVTELGSRLFPVEGAPTITIRYEDLATDPQTCRRAVRALYPEFDIPSGQIAQDSQVHFDTNHMVAGNPMRFDRGETRLKPDQEWRTRLSLAKRVGVTAITWPLLRDLGYRINGDLDAGPWIPSARATGKRVGAGAEE